MASERPRVVGYVRVSTAEQATSGLSLEAQRAKLAAYATCYELDLAAVVEDAGASAKSLERPGLERALGMLDAGEASGLLVAKLDRLTRSVRDLGFLLERYFAPGRSALLSVGENVDTRSAAGRLVLNVLTSVAQWEREAIGERTATALAELKAHGRAAGTVPFGYRADAAGLLVEEPGEQEIMAEARRLRASGATVREIAGALESQGRRTRRGGRFGLAQVHAMVTKGATS